MRVSMLLPGPDYNLVARMRDCGVEARVVGVGRTVVYLPKLPGCSTIFRVLPEVSSGQIQLESGESGGANGSRIATVICGFGGRPLLPYFVARPGNVEPCGEVARFVTPEGVITISVDKRQLRIQRHQLLVDRDLINPRPISVSILSELLWEGEARATAWKCRTCGELFEGHTFDVHHAKGQPGWLCWGELEVIGLNLPVNLARFQDAAITALEKSRCVGCTHAHFVRERQSPALVPTVATQPFNFSPTYEDERKARSEAKAKATQERLAAEAEAENKRRQEAILASQRRSQSSGKKKQQKAGSRR